MLVLFDRIYEERIEEKVNTFISYRFEDIVKSYFVRCAHKSLLDSTIINAGRYWYDDKKNKRNGEFDLVLDKGGEYEVWECKFLGSKMQKSLMNEEVGKIKSVTGINISSIGFCSSSGFDFSTTEYKLLSGDDLYKDGL